MTKKYYTTLTDLESLGFKNPIQIGKMDLFIVEKFSTITDEDVLYLYSMNHIIGIFCPAEPGDKTGESYWWLKDYSKSNDLVMKRRINMFKNLMLKLNVSAIVTDVNNINNRVKFYEDK